VFPDTKFPLFISTIFPQSHLHITVLVSGCSSRTVKNPIFFPVIGFLTLPFLICPQDVDVPFFNDGAYTSFSTPQEHLHFQ
jgi:hypothetical protein